MDKYIKSEIKLGYILNLILEENSNELLNLIKILFSFLLIYHNTKIFDHITIHGRMVNYLSNLENII